MKAKTPTLLVLTLVFALVLCGAVSAANTNVTVADVQVPFIENQGQTDTSLDYYADTYYGTAYVTEDGITHSVTVDNSTGVALQEQFLNENGQPVAVDPQGEEQSQTHVNYFIGNDPSKWQTNLQTYNLVNLGELYNGITVKVRANGGNIEKLFYLQPGSNVNNILVQILGANSLQILEDGTLAIQTDAGIINMSAPQAYQGDQTVNVAYRLLSENIYGFTTGNYDDSKELIIDPTLEYSTYLGGSGNTDYGYGIAIDSSNNVYITGYTNSANFSTTTGVFQTNNSGGTDVFVTKLNPSGTGLIYSTYLGGSNNENAWSIAIDSSGNAYVTGLTNSANFPTTTGAYQTIRPGGTYDAFVFKLNPDGTGLIYSTFMGGSDNDQGYDIAVDNSGYAYITGYTKSTNFPITAGAFQTSNLNQGGIASEDAFVSKLNPDGTGLIYSTYLGGGSAGDYGYDIAIDSSCNAYIAGYTGASNFPVTPGAFQTTKSGGYDAFVSKLNPTGANLIYSTFIGATSDDYGYGIEVDNSGNAYICGVTASTSFPTTTGAFQTSNAGGQDVFVSKLNPDGNGLDYCTYIGGSGTDLGRKIVINRSGYAFITGNTGSINFPVTTGAFQTTYGGGTNDAYVSKLNPTGTSLEYNTYLGGTGAEQGRNIAIDSSGSIYITGITNSANFPVTAGAFQMVQGGGTNDAFVAKFSFESSPVAPVADFTATPTTGTAPLQVTFTNLSTDATTYAWDFDNNGTTDSTDQNPIWNYSTAGTYTIKLTATGPGGTDDEIKTGYITVSGTPDLVTSDMQVPSSPVLGTASPVSATVTNSGNGDAASFVVKLYDNNIQVAKTTLASLASVASTPVSFDWTPTTIGEHVLAVITDANQQITESDETNNQVSAQTTVNSSTQPDLTVTNLQLPSNPTIGTTSQVMVTVTNNGIVDANAFVVKLYDNNTQYATISLAGLVAGASANVTFDWLTYTTGAHNLSVIADANQQITEYNESNNQISQQAIVSQSTLPDLAVSNLQLPANPTVAINSQVTVTVTNNGTVDSGAFVVKLYDNNSQIAKINLTGLDAGASADVNFDWTTFTAGNHNLSVIADANQQIIEYNENNNQISQALIVNPSTQPDLTITDLQLPANPVAGTTYQITTTVTNLGTVDAGAFAVKLYDNNTQLGKINLTSLAAGTSTVVTFNWTPITGTHNLAIKADANNQITEYNENNNQITQQATVN